MNNKVIAREFKLLSQLLELHGGNSFKIKSLLATAQTISKSPFEIASKSQAELSGIPGIGKSSALKIQEILTEGSIQELRELVQQTPPGIISLLKVKGIGPKKIATIWKELGIDTIGELWYACKENKIAALKGFGQKTQEELKNLIEFTIENEGKLRYADTKPIADELITLFHKLKPDSLISLTGDLRRYCEIIDRVEVVLEIQKDDLVLLLQASGFFAEIKEKDDSVECLHQSGIKTVIYFCEKASFFVRLWETTGSKDHVQQIKQELSSPISSSPSEEEIYKLAGLAYIPTELREGLNEIQLAKDKAVPKLIEVGDFKGALHNHSLWSDGIFSIEDMAFYCRDVLRLDYFGVSDHSKTAIYAGGLSIDRVKAQIKEIDGLNSKMAPFRIFKGIESDILSDGSLDYPNELLAELDFVVASIHSQLNMDCKKATTRLLKAIENPYTTILGHPTGRQLLVRKGYPIDHKKIIDACAANGVIMEINCNPLRLDLDWRWIPYCLEKGVRIAVNPDAHHTSELEYLLYGHLVARKGGLSAENCFNCLDLDQVANYFSSRKLNIIR